MNDHSRYVAMQTPSANYDFNKFNKLTRPKIFECKIVPDNKAHINKYKIIKSKNPDSGTYENLSSFRKTQTHGYENKVFMSKCPKTSFLDGAVRAKRHSLGPGHYAVKNIENAYNRISSSPVSMRTRRH